MYMNIANTCAHSGVTRTSALHKVSPEAGVGLDAYKKISQQTGSKGTSRVALFCVSQLQELASDILFVHQY